MGKYVKSYSNYVLKSKHQEINDGVIYERDITTIGGRDRFAKGQVPIYRSGNFVITVNNDNTVYKKTPSYEWKGNDKGDIWTLDILKEYEKDEKSSYDKNIVIKKDYYDLRDFAYFGSCSELIRTSVNNIIDGFPGELFIPIIYTWVFDDGAVFYSQEAAEYYAKKIGVELPEPTDNTISVVYTDDKNIDSGEDYLSLPIKRTFKLPNDVDNGENAFLFVIDNPFGIDVHSNMIPSDGDALKYFADGGVNNYVGYQYINGEWDFDNELPISINNFVQYFYPERRELIGVNVDTLCLTDVDKISATGSPKYFQNYCPGDYMGHRDITVGNCSARIYVFMGDGNEVRYFIDKKRDNCFLNIRIRPKNDIIEDYYDSLNSFEKILLDRSSNYEATFEVINESDYGYYIEAKKYIFPTTYGGYNLGSKNSSFSEYIESLVKIGEYYDERFTDNMWRSMTHEAIKNFDWTYTRHYEPGDEEEYVEGGSRIQKIIRIYGREFDEIRSYIDAIKDNNTITYDNINNLPDYFFTDKLEDDGWDVKLINPFKLTEYVNGREITIPINQKESAETTNTYNGQHIDRVFTEDYGIISIKPYSKTNITSLKQVECKQWMNIDVSDSACTNDKVSVNFEQFNELENSIDLKVNSNSCICDGNVMSLTPEIGENQSDGYHDRCCHDIKIYSSEKEYTISDVNSEFLKRFILNSKDILKHKGTINSIEMLLSLFGMKSKNYVYSNETYFQTVNNSQLELTEAGNTYYKKTDLSSAEAYDYDIKEYTMFTTRFPDEYDSKRQMFTMDWINSLKLATYDTPESRKGKYVSYQGLPVAYRTDKIDENIRYIYPSFQNYLQYDGGVYYQMNGGWLSKNPFMFDTKNNIIPVNYTSNNSKNSELFTETIKNIKCVQTLSELLSNKSLATTSGDICEVVDLSGRYAIIDGLVYTLLKDESFDFFYAAVTNKSLRVGNSIFTGYVYISNPFAENNKLKINLDDDSYNGKSIKIYVINGDVDVHTNTNSISTFTLFENGKYMSGDNFTHYFRLNNPDFSNELSVFGWQQLRDTEYEYYLMDSIVDYNKGNNPHTGHMNYDKGHEYLTYFRHLFKTVYENSLFDLNAVDDDNIDVYSESYKYGFTNLIDEDVCVKNYDKYLYEDDKCHYFGDIFYKNGTYIEYNLDDPNYLKGTIRKTDLGIGNLKKMYYADSISSSNVDGVTNQILNTKRVDIDFYLNSDVEYSNEWLEEVKYIDSIVLPYLTQLVPSTIILTVNYKRKHQKYC